jgi:hypothetical protein
MMAKMMGQHAQMLAECALVCTSCADACLGEPMVADLVRCIRLNLDCADVCDATSRVITRQTMTESAPRRELLAACAAACRVCAEECERHAAMHEHCRICAEHCRHCVQVCESLLQTA